MGETVLHPLARRWVMPVLLSGVTLFTACASVSKDQAETEALMWDAARECKQRYLTIQSVDRIDHYGRLHFTAHGSGPENAAFLRCYHETTDEKIRTAANIPAERVVLDDARARRIVVRGQLTGGALVVPARINGSADARLLVDTGSTWTLLSPKLASQLELPIGLNTRRSVVVLAGGQEVAVPRVRVASVKLGPVAVENLYIGVYELFPTIPEIQGVVGMDFLRHFRVSIDPREPRLLLSPLSE
jgi:predicted aspartyl protease